ncbi:MAG TPA: hypothetical protein VFC78_23795 [Tepidisphaeraceae bacterium]|nr:hypothetical protein [Tepidisphaeraceae bacterium]
MKSFIILVLIAGLATAVFFTRPNSDDFKQYVKDHPEIVNGQAAKGDSITDKISHQMKSFSVAGVTLGDPVQDFLSHCTFNNQFGMWTTVSKDGQVIYTGMLGHWFPRNGTAPAKSV